MQISVSPKVLPNIIAVSPWLFGTPFESGYASYAV